MKEKHTTQLSRTSQLKINTNSAKLCTLTVHCSWEDETMREGVREGASHIPSYAEAMVDSELA